MQAYIYLSSLINLLLALTSYYSLKILSLNKMHKGLSFMYIIIHAFFIFLTFIDFIYAVMIIVLFNVAFHFFMDKKNFIINLVIYNTFYYLLSIVLSLLSDGLKIYNGVLLLTSKNGLLVSLLIPVFGILMLFSSLIIDKTFHLHNYQEVTYLTIGNKTMELKSYYDTGNTLLYNNTPVIFLSNSNNIFDDDEFNIEMQYQTIACASSTHLARGLITIKGKKDEYFVYIGKSKMQSTYHGCQLLLNAYLF